MKERPILFSAPMVRAILENRKTVTRRIVKYIPDLGEPPLWCHRAGSEELRNLIGDYRRYCPYGQPVDKLWVRETWAARPDQDQLPPNMCDNSGLWWRASLPAFPQGYESCHGKWRPSIHMPRWASRINLEVTSVKAERLQDITEMDAMAEGIVECPIPADEDGPNRIGYMVGPDDGKSGLDVSPRDSFRKLWESINGPGSWDLNPWVWALSFKKI